LLSEATSFSWWSIHLFMDKFLDENAASSILEEKTDRKNLSLSSGEDERQKAIRSLEALTEDDIAFHWPELARQGFGTDQIRQILNRLT
jgi:hypothetical protein